MDGGAAPPGGAQKTRQKPKTLCLNLLASAKGYRLTSNPGCLILMGVGRMVRPAPRAGPAARFVKMEYHTMSKKTSNATVKPATKKEAPPAVATVKVDTSEGLGACAELLSSTAPAAAALDKTGTPTEGHRFVSVDGSIIPVPPEPYFQGMGKIKKDGSSKYPNGETLPGRIGAMSPQQYPLATGSGLAVSLFGPKGLIQVGTNLKTTNRRCFFHTRTREVPLLVPDYIRERIADIEKGEWSTGDKALDAFIARLPVHGCGDQR